MRIYLDLKDRKERSNYIKFMEEVFSTSFHLSKSIKLKRQIYCYTSKKSKFDICWIRCENFNSITLLASETINEKRIYLITCTPQDVIQNVRKRQLLNLYKNIYLPLENKENDFLSVMAGKSYGMNFNPAQCELNLFRLKSVHKLEVCLEQSFNKVYPLLESRFYGQHLQRISQ